MSVNIYMRAVCLPCCYFSFPVQRCHGKNITILMGFHVCNEIHVILTGCVDTFAIKMSVNIIHMFIPIHLATYLVDVRGFIEEKGKKSLKARKISSLR